MNSLILEPLYLLIQQVFVAHYGQIYLQGDYPWERYSLGLIYITNQFEEPQFEVLHHDFLQTNYLKKVFHLADVQDIVSNAFNQKKHVTVDELIACFNFYFIKDAFLNLLNPYCRICGLFQPEPPRDEDDVPSWEICDCCGSQAGADDIDINMIRIRRKTWLDAGANWLNPMVKPLYWDLKKQLEDIPPEFV